MNSSAPAKPKLRSQTEAARQMFLYGEGDGVRVLDMTELAKKSGASLAIIKVRLPDWKAEYEEIVRGSSKLANAGSLSILSLPESVSEEQRMDNEFIRKRLDKAKNELEKLPQLIEQLSLMISESAADPDKIQEMFSLLDKYLRLSMNEKSLTRLFIDLKKLWDEKVGLDAIKAIQVAHAKALKPTEKAEEPSPAEGNLSVFRR